MTVSEIYVDPAIAADSGSGTIGDPFGDVEYGIRQTVFDTTNGTRTNIKDGVAEVLAADLSVAMADTSVTPAWAPSETARCIFQGYTSVADDGGKGSIDCDGGSFLNDDTADFIDCVDLVVYNGTYGFRVDTNCHCMRSRFHSFSNIAIEVDNGYIADCYIHGCTNQAIRVDVGFIERCYIDHSGSSIAVLLNGGTVVDCILSLGSSYTSVGIWVLSNDNNVNRNSIFADGAAATGIEINGASTAVSCSNNLVAGLSGVGGIGIAIEASMVGDFVGNGVYDCTNPYTDASNAILYEEDNEILTESPFVDAANGDFSPVDTGNVIGGALPQIVGGGFVPGGSANVLQLNKGAVQEGTTTVNVPLIRDITGLTGSLTVEELTGLLQE